MADIKAKLLAAALKARKKAYAPYSRFSVGAAVLASDGRVFSGCNVENASFGLTCCAERNAIFAMVASGGKKIQEVLVIGETAEPLPPCGACRQVMAEFASPSTVIHLCNRRGESLDVTLEELLPRRFRLDKRPARSAARTTKGPSGSR
ncbi:MAG: cytidine deaminase [Candidatus Aminicenantes bacterium]|nr:cytidine deaminase [Candidatus Aminicenantes bacterium]